MRCKDTKKFKVKEWEKIFYVNSNQKKAGWLYYYQTKWTLNKKNKTKTGAMWAKMDKPILSKLWLHGKEIA